MTHAHAGSHDAPADAHAPGAGPHEIPPVPAERIITPAPEDFRSTPPFGAMLWPLAWMGVAALVWALVAAAGWPETAAGGV